MKDWNKALFKTLEHRKELATDYMFLKQLSKWILDFSGNINVSMRLIMLAAKLKKGGKYNERR